MRLWTVHPVAVWKRLQREAVLFLEPQRMGVYKYVPWQYEWLAEQVLRRVPAWGGGLPWFAYGETPDLRWVRHRHAVDTRHVRLELQPAPGSFAVFPMWAWNEVYCGRYLTLNRREHEEWNRAMEAAVPDFEDAWPLPPPWDAQLRASWERLFDPDLPATRWNEPPAEGYADEREAVLGALRLDEVREVTHFVGASHRLRPYVNPVREDAEP